MNRLCKTDGIVLKNIRLNESDKIVTIFSNKFGKIRVVAKGIRKTKSQFGSSLENLTQVRIIFYRGRNLDVASQTEIIRSFFSKCRNLKRYGLAIHCAEIVNKLLPEGDKNTSVYDLFKETLVLLEDDKNPYLMAESFKWKLFTFLGYQPNLNYCVKCHKKIKRKDSYFFDIVDGGLICSNCFNKNKQGVKISDYCVRLIKRILEADLQKIHNKDIGNEQLEELLKITEKYMLYHFEIKDKSRYFLIKLKSMESQKEIENYKSVKNNLLKKYSKLLFL